ncbi:MAG: dihydroorotate dehydrogenase [Defluviitaleaceae bacterium]|nr:dihydroorotate dehydrogenase [Defluviitaleaceae bacterium]MCL2835488.1 dihydroorotate dehydrogenase [Defluviitaleaceae bacterium]
MRVNLSGVEWKNPVTTASGTFGSGREFAEFFELGKLGAVTVKGVSLKPWAGNPPPRIAETFGGMLNSIGLQNPGVEAFIRDDIPFLRGFNVNIIVNVCGNSIDEYAAVIERLASADIDMLELNISCPNISSGGIAFGTDSRLTHEVVKRCKAAARQPLFVKLSPNVTDIAEIAKAAEAGGADGLSLINTLVGMKIDIRRKKPLLGNRVGGLSGPAIMPVAVRAVYQVYKAVRIPIIGMGGITTGSDAVEFLMAGASAVAVGTAGLINPYAVIEVIEGIEQFMQNEGYSNIKEIVGCAHNE